MASITTNADIRAAQAAGVSTYDYCVVYRTGGREMFTWRRSLAMSQAEAQATLANVQRQGYAAHIARYSQSIAIGLPETYE